MAWFLIGLLVIASIALGEDSNNKYPPTGGAPNVGIWNYPFGFK